MAGAFNLTAQLNLKGPSNIGNIITGIKNQLGNINTTVKFTLDPNAAKNVAQLNGNLQTLNQTLKDTQTNATSAANALKLLGSSIGQIGSNQLQSSLAAANQASQQLTQTQSALKDSIKASSSEMQEFGKQAGLAVRRFTAFSTVTGVIYGLSNAASRGVSAFIDFDKQFVKLQQVTGESEQGLKALAGTITGLSTGLGVSSSELINVASTLAQAGLNASDTEKALKALALSSLAPSFDNMNETVEGSIALMRQFGISAGELDKALGSVNAVAAKFAVEASDIISAVQRTGGVFAAASRGVSEGTDALNEFISVFTSVRATTRESAETIATGLRTIFTRIQREGTIEALKEYGVNLTDVSGKFVGAYKSVELLSKGLSSLDPRDLKFSRIVEELGGFRQIGKVIPLIQEFATAQQALGVAQQGQGSLTADSIKAQMSLANQISKTREEFLKLFREIGSSDSFQTLVRGSLQVANALIKVADSARGLLPLLGVIAVTQGAKAITKFASGFGEGLTRGGNNKNDSESPSPTTPRVRNFAVGGLVPGVGESDTVPAMLTPGEFVVRKAAVRSIGVDRLHSMNKYAGGGKAVPKSFTVQELEKTGGPETIIEFSQKKKTVEPDDKIYGKINKIEKDLGPRDFREIIKRSEEIANQSSAGKSSYKDLELSPENKQNYLDVYFGKGSNKRKWNPQASLWKSAEKRWGSAFEDYIVDHSDDALQSIAGGNFPVDIKRKRGSAIGEAKFRSVEEQPEVLISKLFRYRIKASEQKLLSQFKEAKKNEIDDVDVGSIDYFWAGKSKEKFYQYLFDNPDIYEKMNVGGVAKARKSKEVFGTGETTFPARIRKKYAEEKQRSDETIRANLAWNPYPDNERITVDETKVQEAFQQPFDRTKFTESFKQKISRNTLFSQMADFAKFIGLPQEELARTLPLQLDFGGPGMNMWASASFQQGARGSRPYEGYDLSRFGYGEAQKQEAYGLEKLIEAKKKEIKKIVKTPIRTFDDGSFSYDDVAYTKANDELRELQNRSFKLADLKREAQKIILDEQEQIASSTGRGTVSFAAPLGRTSNNQNNILYHELTHQLFKGLKNKSSESFEKYKERVVSLFSGDNDELADAFDSLSSGTDGGYTSADVVYGRSYKMSQLQNMLMNYYRQGSPLGSREPKPIPEDITKNIAGLSRQGDAAKKARDFRPLNPRVNEALLTGTHALSQDVVDRLEDAGKEEFLTTLVQKSPQLDANLQTVLGDTLTSLLGSAGIKRQNYATGGVAQRKVGYIDYDVIANPDNAEIIKKEMEAIGTTGPRLYTDKLTQLAVQSRKDNDLQKLRAVYGVAGSGKTTLARGQGTDNATLRQTERFPILSPEDIQKATEVIVLSSSVSKDKLDNIFDATDRTYTLSSTTKQEREEVRSRRVSRDITGVGLENRKPGSTSGVATDTAVGEALLSDRLGDRSVVLGRSSSGRLRRKQGDELVDVTKKKIGFTWGGFAPMTAGHESIMDAAAAMGIPPEDFIYLVGSNEGIKPGDPSSYRTAIFDQDTRMILAKAGAGSKGAMVLPKPRDFEVPQAFDITEEGSDRRKVLLPKKGSRTFVADKGPEQTKKYKEAGYAVSNIERTGGISGTMVRDLIMSGNMGELQQVLSPNVYDIISNNIGRLQNRANVLPDIIEQVQKSQGVELAGVEKEIKSVGISRIDNKKAAADPEYAAKVEALQELRDKRDRIKSAASFEPYRILEQMAQKNPEKYGLNLGSAQPEASPMRTMSSGIIQRFLDGGWVKRMQSQKKSILKEDLQFLQSAMLFSDETGSYVPTYVKKNEKEVVDAKEMLERYNAMSQFIGGRSPKSGLKPTDQYNSQELLDAVTYYQAGSGPLTRAMINNDFIFTDRDEAYDTEDLVGRLTAASQYKLPKKLYSGFGRGQFNEILKDTNITPDDLVSKSSQTIDSLVGKTVDFPTFLSTSVNKTVADSFVGDPGALFTIDSSKSKSLGIDILKAKATAATNSAPTSRRLPGLDKIKPHKLAGYDQEKEFILQPNSQFKILSAKGTIADSLKETLTGIKKNTQKSSTMTSDKGEEFTVYEPDYENDIAEKLNTKTRIDIQAQMFASGGRVLSPLLQSIYDSMATKPDWLKEFGLPNNITTDVPADTISKLFAGQKFPTDSAFGLLAGETVTPDIVRKIWRSSYSPLMSQEKIENFTAAKNYLSGKLKSDTEEQTRLTVRDINKSTKLAVVGLQPSDKREVQGPMTLGNKNATLFISGLSSKYENAVQNMRAGVSGLVRQFGSDIQDTEIFKSSDSYAFDFDETLVAGADILDANGKPDIPRYGDIDAVRESMKGAKLTQLGEKVKRLMALDPSFIKKSRILTARPQMTAGILAETLQGLGLPFQESDITGVSKPVKDGGLDIVDETTKRINNTIIAKAKAQDVRELESLIDDNLQNVLETRKAGKRAFNYTELRDLSEPEKAASGFANIEGAVFQAVMSVMGASGGIIQNGAVDYENGLGPAAQYFPGIGSDWPTEVKRTLDSTAIADAKQEFTRFYREKSVKDIPVQAMAVGGIAEAPVKKEKQFGKISITEDAGMISAGYLKNNARSGHATAYKLRDYLYYVGLSSATSGYGPRLYDVLMEAATEKGAMLTSDRSLVSGDARKVWEYYFNNRSDVQKTPLKPSDWTLNQSLIDPKLYGKEDTWPPATDPAWVLQSGYSKSPSIINTPDVIRNSGTKLDSRALMDSFFAQRRESSKVKMAEGGQVDEGLAKYKQVLSSILPPEFLSDEGLLRTPEGGSEQIQILSPPKKQSFFSRMMSRESTSVDTPPASYEGALPYKVLRHRLGQNKQMLSEKEYGVFDRYISQNLAFHGKEDTIDVRRPKYKAALAHETFHDIQGFLYDNYPEIIDKLQSSIDTQKDSIEKWYKDPVNSKYTGPGTYQLEHFFPTQETKSPYGTRFIDESLASFRKAKTETSIPALKTIGDANQDLGRNELIPVLLNATAEGNRGARQILSSIFGSSGLNKDFYRSLPKFATGGIVPGVGNSDTVPAMLNAGDFVIKKSSVNSVGADKLAAMAGYASGGSVSDQVPALLTPGEFVFSKSSAEKIGYNKLHSINNLGKFANGGYVGGRLALASGGEANPFIEVMSRFFDYLNEVDSRKLPIKPGQNTTTDISIDGSVIDVIKELSQEIESLGIRSSETAVLLRRGGDISYRAATEAYTADLQRLKLSSASTEQIIKAENDLAQIREKSLRVTVNRSLIESSFAESQTGQSAGFGAAQQKVLLDAEKFEAGIQRKKEKDFAKLLNTAPGGMLGASSAELSQAARTLANSPEEKMDTKNTAMLVAMQKNTGIKRSEFTDVGLSGSDLRQYIAQTSLDRKTLAEMDKQLIRSKIDELKNSQGFGSLLLSEQKRRLDEVRELAQKEIEARRNVLNEIAKSQGLPSLTQKDPGTQLADFLKSPRGVFLSGALSVAPRAIRDNFVPTPTNAESAANRAGTVGGLETFAAGLQVAGRFGSFAPLAAVGAAAAGLATAFKEARNAFIDFSKNLASKELQVSINNLQQSFNDLAKDITDVSIRENISRDLRSGLSRANRITDIENNTPRVDSYFRNIIDAFRNSNSTAAVDRSKILERFGTSAYFSSSLNDDNRRLYNERLIPERAQENAKQYTDLAQFAQKSLETMVQTGKSFDEIKVSPEYDDIASSLAKANIRVQEQILAIDNNNTENTAAAKANREAAKAAVIRAFADDQAAKITKNFVRERQAELANRESRAFGMSFDRMFNNMNQSIETTNYNLSKFSDALDSSASALSGQAKLSPTNLDAINILKNPNASSPEQRAMAIDQASSLFSSEKGLVGSILKLGDGLESSIMMSINQTIRDNPGASDTKIAMDIEKVVANKLSETRLPSGLTEQLSKEINAAIEGIRKKEGADTKNRRIDFSELLAVAPALRDTFETLKNTQNAVISSLENWKNRLDAYSKSLDKAADIQLEAAQRRNKAEDILINGSIELSRAFGGSINPSSGAELRDYRTARLTGGPTSVPDIVASIQALEQRRNNQRESLASFKNSTVGQTGSVQAIIDNERALSRTNYQLNQTYAALKNLAESSEAASVAMSALQNAQQKQAGKVSLLEKLIGSTPEELYNFNNALRRLQLTASGQQLSQTADQRKEVLNVMNDILPLLGSSQEANNLKANTLENLLRDSGIGVNVEFAKIIQGIRNPEADPAIKLAAEQFRQANEKQAEANRALAGLGDTIANKMIESSAAVLKSALENTIVKFDQIQVNDILKGLRDASTVVRPIEPDRKASGGIIYASAGSMIDFTPKGTDTVPAMLTPGEFVVNRSATQKHLPLLQNINSGSYSTGGQVKYYSDGGYVSNALKPEYKDGINLKKSGKLSTQYSYPQLPSVSDLEADSMHFYTLTGLTRIARPNDVGRLALPTGDAGSTKAEGRYNFSTELGVGFPDNGKLNLIFPRAENRRSAAAPTVIPIFKYGTLRYPRADEVGKFIDPASSYVSDILKTKKLEFDGPEANAIVQKNNYANVLQQINDKNLLPKDISIGESVSISSDKGAYSITPTSSNKLKKALPVSVSISKDPAPRTKSFDISFSNLSSLISDSVGMIPSTSPVSGAARDKDFWSKLNITRTTSALLDFIYSNNNIETKQYSDISSQFSFTDQLAKSPNYAGNISQSGVYESSNLEQLANITKTIKDAREAITKETKLIEPDSDIKLRQKTSFLRNLYQGTSVFEPVDSELFDIKGLGATQDQIKVFSTDILTWNTRYLEAIENNIKLKKDKNLDSLNYFGKNPGPGFRAFEVWQDGKADSKILPWTDKDVPIDQNINDMMQRAVETNVKNITPDLSTAPKKSKFNFKKGPILSQDVSLDYELDFQKYLNRYWDPQVDGLSDEQILDGKPLYLLQPGTAPLNPFRSFPFGGNRELFTTDAGYIENTIGNNLFNQLSTDNQFLEYLSAVISDGYTSDKAQKLEAATLDKFYSIDNTVADKVGMLTLAGSIKGQRSKLFVKTDDIFAGPKVDVSLRDFLLSSVKDLSKTKQEKKELLASSKFSSLLDKYDLDRDGKLSDDEKDAARKDGVDVDKKSYFERSEYPGAALAMILGAQDLFGPGKQYEIPGVLGPNWFLPTLSNAYNSIYDVPNDRIKSYMGELAGYISSKYGDIDGVMRYFAQTDPATYDTLNVAKSYMLGAEEAFKKFGSGDTESIVGFFPSGIFKNQTPNGDPVANQAAVEMFAKLGRASSVSDIETALVSAKLSTDDKKEFGDKLEGSKIARFSTDGKVTYDKFSSKDLENSKGESSFKQIYSLALNPYNQFTNRSVRESLLDEFIRAIPTATKTDGTPLFGSTTGPEFDKSLRTLRRWYSGDGQAVIPLKSWPGIDYLYDQTILDPATGDTIPFSARFQDLINNLDEKLYADAITSHDYVGGKQIYGDLPTAQFYETKEPAEPQYRQSGGIIYANKGGSFVNFKPRGPDTIPAMLSAGEFVVNATATSKNLPLLKAINEGQEFDSADGYQFGGLASSAAASFAQNPGSRPFREESGVYGGSNRARARTISQARAYRMRDIGFSSRLTDREINPANGIISWISALPDDPYKKNKDAIQAAFARLAESGKPESFETYQSTTKLFQDLRALFDKNKTKTKPEDYRKTQRFINSLEKEYLLASRGGGIRLFESDNIFKDKGLEYDEIDEKIAKLIEEAKEQFKNNPTELKHRLEGLSKQQKAMRIAKMGLPPRLSETGMNTQTGELSFTSGIKDSGLDTTGTQAAFTDMAGRGQESRLTYPEYKAKQDEIRELRAELKSKVNDMNAGDYGRSATYLDSLERELDLSARGGGLGVGSKPDMYKPRPYADTRKQRIAQMGSPREINERFLDPKTGRITWPLVLTDNVFDQTRTKIDSIYADLMSSDMTNMSYKEFSKKSEEFKTLSEEMKDNVSQYGAGNYGESRSFLDSLTATFNKVSNRGKERSNTDWRQTGDPRGASVNGAFLKPDGSIVWPSVILRDPAFAKFRAAVEKDMTDAAALDGAKFDPKQSSSFQDFIEELKDKQEDFGGLDPSHYQARSFIEGLQRSYRNASQGKPFGGMTLSDYRTQQAEQLEQKKQEDMQFRMDNPVERLSNNPQSTQRRADKLAESITYSSISDELNSQPLFSVPGVLDSDTGGVLDSARYKAEVRQIKEDETRAEEAKVQEEQKKQSEANAAAVARRKEYERKQNARWSFDSRVDRIKEKLQKEAEQTGAWDPTRYWMAFRKVSRSDVPFQEGWKEDDFRRAVEAELATEGKLAYRDWKGATPPKTYYTNSPEYKDQQEKKQKEREIRGPYAPGLAGGVDKAADELTVFAAQTSSLPMRTMIGVSETLNNFANSEDYGPQKEALDKLRREQQDQVDAMTVGARARLAEQEKRVAIGTDRDMFGANVGDKAQAQFLKLTPAEQKEYLDLRSRAQKGMKREEYTRLDYFQKTLGIPWQQREAIPRGYESSEKDTSQTTRPSTAPRMQDMRAFKDNMPLLGSRQYIESLPGAFEEGATLGTILTKESSAYGDRAKETAIGTGEVVTGVTKAGVGGTLGVVAKGAAAVSLPGSEGQAMLQAFGDSALETAGLGVTQMQKGASRGVGKNIVDPASAMIFGETSDQATFYRSQQQAEQKRFDATFQKQKAQAEDLSPGLGTSYERSENLAQTALTAATLAALQEVAVGAFTKPTDYSQAMKSAGSGQTPADKLFEGNIGGRTQWSMKTKPFPRPLSTPTQTITTPKPNYSNSITVSAGEPITPSISEVANIPRNPDLLTGGRLGNNAFVSYDQLVEQGLRSSAGRGAVVAPDATNIFADIARENYLSSLESEVNSLAESMRFATGAVESTTSSSLLSKIPTSVKTAVGTAAAVEGARRLTSSTEDKPKKEPEKKALGGLIRGYAVGGVVGPPLGPSPYAQGTDTVEAMLEPGEFVVNAKATAKNLPLLQKLNKGGPVYLADGTDSPIGTISLTSPTMPQPQIITSGTRPIVSDQERTPAKPWIMSDNPVVAGVGAAGASLDALSYAIYGGAKIAGATTLAVGSSFADMENTLSYGIGLRDKNSYDQRSAAIQGFNASLEDNAEAGLADIGNYLQVASGNKDLMANDGEHTFATAAQDRKDVDAVTQEFGTAAGTALWTAQAASYITTNALAGEAGLDPIGGAIKATANAPQIARQTRAVAGKAIVAAGAPELGSRVAMNAADTALASQRVVDAGRASGTRLATGTSDVAATPWFRKEGAALRPSGQYGSIPRTTVSAVSEIPAGAAFDVNRTIKSAEGVTVAGHLSNALYTTHIGASNADEALGAARSAVNYSAEGLAKGASLETSAVILPKVKNSAIDAALTRGHFDSSSVEAVQSMTDASKSLGLELGDATGKTASELQTQMTQQLIDRGLTTETAAQKVHEYLPNGISAPSSQLELRPASGTTVAFKNPSEVLEAPLGDVMTLAELTKRDPLFSGRSIRFVEAEKTLYEGGMHLYGKNESPENYAFGGMVFADSGAFIPKGKDKVPAMLTPGEFVVNSDATQKHLGLLQQINSGSIEYASNGALIGTKSKNIDTRPSANERSVLGAVGTGYYSRGGIVEYLKYGGRSNSQFIGESPIASGNALYRPENERVQYQAIPYASDSQNNIVNQSTNMATQSGVLNNNTNMQQSSGPSIGGMDITAIQKVFENFRQDLTVLQESVTQFTSGAETVASSASQYKEFSNNLANSSDKLANLSLPDQLNVNVTSSLDKLGASVTSEISGTIMRSNQGIVNGLQNYSDKGDAAMAKKGFDDSEGALNFK